MSGSTTRGADDETSPNPSPSSLLPSLDEREDIQSALRIASDKRLSEIGNTTQTCADRVFPSMTKDKQDVSNATPIFGPITGSFTRFGVGHNVGLLNSRSPCLSRRSGHAEGGGVNAIGGRVKKHARSASHVGILVNRETTPITNDNGVAVPTVITAGAFSKFDKGHQRAFSQGQTIDGRGHRRQSSKTDFILPEGHEQRERQRELRSTKSSVKKSSLQRKGHSREASRTDSVYTIRDHRRSLLQRLFFWKRNASECCTRLVVPNHVVTANISSSDHPNHAFPGNEICTTKYTLLSFIPRNLYEQFHRFANLYFLFIVLLNFVPSVNAFAKELAMMPLLFVLGVTAIKDAFEDRRRYRSDKRVNSSTCRVYCGLQGRYVKRKWKDLKVGDIIHLSCDEVIPADMVLLNASDEHGVCYIESSNLDGETNLKQRQSIRVMDTDDNFEVSKFDYVLEVGPPTTKIYHFVGSIPVRSKENIPLTKDNIILRDCVIKNTDFVEGIVVYAGRETKALLNNGGTRYKRSQLERQMNREVIWCVVILILICLFSSTGSALWQSTYIGNSSLGYIPFLPPSTFTDSSRVSVVDGSPTWIAFTSFWTFIILYQVLIPISLYVTIEIIKLMQIYHIQEDPHFRDEKKGTNINCRALNIPEELGQVQYLFTDKTGTLTENNMVFQRCSINGIDYDHFPVIVTDKKLNASDTFTMNSDLQEELNSIELQYIYNQPGSRQAPLRCSASQSKDSQRTLDFFFTLAACNTVIVAKHPRKDQMNASGMIIENESNGKKNEENNTTVHHSPLHPYAQTSNGKNHLFRSLFPFPRSLSPIASSPTCTPPTTPDSSPRQTPTFSLSRFVSFPNPNKATKAGSDVNITLNTFESYPDQYSSAPNSYGKQRPNVLHMNENPPRILHHSCSPSTPPPLDIKPIYEAESPDELALVDAAYKYGCRLLRRNMHSVVVSLPGSGFSEFEILHVLPFDSNRKRMSIIIKHPETGEKILYCKGADSSILENLASIPDESTKLLVFRTQQQLNMYSKKGLRVLCMAKRVLLDSEYEEWSLNHKQAENSLVKRDQKLYESYCKIENNLELTGATGIEDRLQEGVPETIKALKSAGIVVWVLTGDKQETAINVAYACALFTPNMEILKLNACTKEQTERTIYVYIQQIEEQELLFRNGTPTANINSTIQNGQAGQAINGDCRARRSLERPKPRGLVIDGRTLVFILDRRANLKMAFLKLAGYCNAVMCCRATPLQKALIVRSAKDKLKVLTLAVGDGANDVSMIQTADVGIGISGVEGRQAVMASDYAITRFCHLEKLILVHGHWCYDRLSRIILYFFYKNACFVFLLMWYQLYCGFSTNIMFDDMYLVMYNLMFTSLPPMTVGIYDQDAPAELLLSQPHLYAKTRLGTVYTSYSFWINIIDAFYQSVVLFFCTAVVYDYTEAGVYEFGMTVNHSCLVTVLLHISIETKSWTVIHVAGIGLCYVVYFVFGFMYTVACNGCLGLPSQYGEIVHMISTPKHWLCVLFTSVVALLPRFVFRSLQTSLFPDEVTRALKETNAVNKGHFVGALSRESSVSTVYRPQNEDNNSDVACSLVTMTTILSTNEEADA